MKLLTAPERARLLANGQIRAQAERDNPGSAIDFYPVVRLFTPDAGCTWLLTEIAPMTRTVPSASATSAWAVPSSAM